MENNVLSSTASTADNGTQLEITPTATLAPANEQRIKLLINTATPVAGAIHPVTITLNGSAVPVFDKYGNIVYGNQLYKGLVLKGYYGTNGSGGTSHFQLIRLPVRCCCYER